VCPYVHCSATAHHLHPHQQQQQQQGVSQSFDAMLIERWPLIQAFALEHFGG